MIFLQTTLTDKSFLRTRIILSCIANNDVPVRRIDTSLAPSLLYYFVKGLNKFQNLLCSQRYRKWHSDCAKYGLLNVESWSVYEIGKCLAYM